jgi:zinc transport system ATP-binding protein
MLDEGPLIEASGIDLALGGRTVLRDAGLAVRRGEIVALIGPNGAGKTSLIRVLLGLLRPDRGDVRRLAGLEIGYMPQRLVLDRALPIGVDRFLALAGRGDRTARGARLEEAGVAHLIDQSMHELSGGEVQRVLLARALLRDPDLLVLDEPAQNVDVLGQVELFDTIAELRRRRRCGVLMVSHDLHLVMAATDMVVCLNGHICCTGHPEAVSRHPAYLALLGPAADRLAVYAHSHDHHHGLAGDVVRDAGHRHLRRHRDHHPS